MSLKFTEELCVMAIMNDAKLEEEIDLLFQNWHEEFDEFRSEHLKVPKIFILMHSFWAKYILFELKKVQRSYLSWHWRGIQNLERNRLVISIWHEDFDKFWTKHSKVSKMFTLMGSFWEKYILFEIKNYRGVIEEWTKTWRKTYLWFGKWHEEFDKFSPGHSKVSKLGL